VLSVVIKTIKLGVIMLSVIGLSVTEPSVGRGQAKRTTKTLSTPTQGEESMSQRMQLLMMTGTEKVGPQPSINSADNIKMDLFAKERERKKLFFDKKTGLLFAKLLTIILR